MQVFRNILEIQNFSTIAFYKCEIHYNHWVWRGNILSQNGNIWIYMCVCMIWKSPHCIYMCIFILHIYSVTHIYIYMLWEVIQKNNNHSDVIWNDKIFLWKGDNWRMKDVGLRGNEGLSPAKERRLLCHCVQTSDSSRIHMSPSILYVWNVTSTVSSTVKKC